MLVNDGATPKGRAENIFGDDVAHGPKQTRTHTHTHIHTQCDTPKHSHAQKTRRTHTDIYVRHHLIGQIHISVDEHLGCSFVGGDDGFEFCFGFVFVSPRSIKFRPLGLAPRDVNAP